MKLCWRLIYIKEVSFVFPYVVALLLWAYVAVAPLWSNISTSLAIVVYWRLSSWWAIVKFTQYFPWWQVVQDLLQCGGRILPLGRSWRCWLCGAPYLWVVGRFAFVLLWIAKPFVSFIGHPLWLVCFVVNAGLLELVTYLQASMHLLPSTGHLHEVSAMIFKSNWRLSFWCVDVRFAFLADL